MIKQAERIASMETKLNLIKEIEEKNSKENREDHEKIFNIINDFIHTANTTYATKNELKDRTNRIEENIKDNRTSSSKGMDRVIIYIIALINILLILYLNIA